MSFYGFGLCLYSTSSDQYYVGSTQDLSTRLDYHQIKEFKTSFTAKYSDWELFFSIDHTSNTTARKIEAHIKKIKSRKVIFRIIPFASSLPNTLNFYKIKKFVDYTEQKNTKSWIFAK